MNWQRIRGWGYRVVTASVPLLTAYGVVAEQMAPHWVALAAAVLGTGTAAANTPTRPRQRNSGA